MNKLTLKEIEQWISETDELYYWAADYCKEHHCNVTRFIKANYEDVINIINRTIGE